MAKIKLPPSFPARVKSVHHPAPPPNRKSLQTAATSTGTTSTPSSPTDTSSTTPLSASSPNPSTPQKAPTPGVAVAVTRGRRWNHQVKKYFLYPKHVYVSDPTAAIRAGDTIQCTWWPSLSNSKKVLHTVTEIIKAQGADLPGRNKIWTEEERRAWRVGELLRNGTGYTKKGLQDGTIVIGDGGEIKNLIDRPKKAREIGELA